MGKLYMTRGVNDTIADDTQFSKDICKCLARYRTQDWGEMCAEDKAMNDDAVKSGEDRILAAYETSKGKIYIITEWDRSVTTVLFTHEY